MSDDAYSRAWHAQRGLLFAVLDEAGEQEGADFVPIGDGLIAPKGQEQIAKRLISMESMTDVPPVFRKFS